MIGKRVRWYDNPKRLDIKGEGTLVHLAVLNMEDCAIAVMVDDEGYFHERTIDLVQVVPAISKGDLVKDKKISVQRLGRDI